MSEPQPPPYTPGQYPSGYTDTPGQYPPGYAAQYSPYGSGGNIPPPIPGGIGTHGKDAVDSEDEDYLRSKHDKHPINVKFVNKTMETVVIYWIDESGKFQKLTKLKYGQSKDIDTFESHPFVAKTGADVVINGNASFLPEHVPGGHNSVTANITYSPAQDKLFSSYSGSPVTLKFSNRTNLDVSLKWMRPDGYPIYIKDLEPKTAWLYNALDGHYFTAVEIGDSREDLELNGGLFYLAKQGKPGTVRKVLITEPRDKIYDSSSSD